MHFMLILFLLDYLFLTTQFWYRCKVLLCNKIKGVAAYQMVSSLKLVIQ